METILILGGTHEASEIAENLARDHPDWRIVTSFAGRTSAPRLPAGEIRVGGFGGVDGLADYLRAEKVTRLIDATHPFATTISANALKASQLAGVPLEAVTRPAWQRQESDNWIDAATLEEARDAIPPNARVLLAIGSQHVGVFAPRADVFFLVRMVDSPSEALPLPDHELLIGRPGDVEAEKALFTASGITHIICRNSGGEAAYAKIEAARELGLTIVMLERPGLSAGK